MIKNERRVITIVEKRISGGTIMKKYLYTLDHLRIWSRGVEQHFSGLYNLKNFIN